MQLGHHMLNQENVGITLYVGQKYIDFELTGQWK